MKNIKQHDYEHLLSLIKQVCLSQSIIALLEGKSTPAQRCIYITMLDRLTDKVFKHEK